MGEAQDAYRIMLRVRIAPALRSLGLKGSGQRFRLPSATHWALLAFSRDRYSEAQHLRFTIDANVIERDGWTRAHAAHPWIGATPRHVVGGYAIPKSELTLWHRSFGPPTGLDPHWWRIDTGTDTGVLARELVERIVGQVLPWMREHMA